MSEARVWTTCPRLLPESARPDRVEPTISSQVNMVQQSFENSQAGFFNYWQTRPSQLGSSSGGGANITTNTPPWSALVDERSVLPMPTASWYRPSNCHQSAAEPLRLRLHTSAIRCQLTSLRQAHCPPSVDCWNVSYSSSDIIYLSLIHIWRCRRRG